MIVRNAFAVLLITAFASCGAGNSNEKATVNTDTAQVDKPVADIAMAPAADDQNIAAAKNWLEKNIVLFFQDKTSMEKICTKQYISFKNDGWSMSEGDISNDSFKNKWRKIYNLDLFCSDCGFLIGGQDYGKIKADASFKNKTDKGYWFSTMINDLEFKENYKRDILVVKNGDSFLIDAVLEYL